MDTNPKETSQEASTASDNVSDAVPDSAVDTQAEDQPKQAEETLSELESADRFKIAVLLGSILLVALCSITYELIIGTISSYLLGNSVFHFSLTIGIFMSAMGVGSYLSKFVKTNLLEKFFWVEISVGIFGGISSALLFGVFAFSPYFQPVMWTLTLVIGTLVGLEIPLLTRYIRKYAQLRVAIANVLSWDYIGALFGSLAFPLLLLPSLGLLNSAAVVGMINVTVACLGLYTFRHDLKYKARFIFGAGLAMVGLVTLFFTSGDYERFLDKRLFQDPVIYSEQTPYQKLTLTAWRGKDYRLFINGAIQFSSRDEYRYHEALVHVPMGLLEDPKDVLILGGGDGLVVRQLQKYPGVKNIVMVDLDPRMTQFARTHPTLRRINQDAFEDKRLKVINNDAMTYLMNSKDKFDAVIIDLPDPNNESLSKLYSVSFYRLVRNHLKDNGVMVSQSTATYFATNAFWCIHQTIEKAFCPESGCPAGAQNVLAYHTWIPSFGDWGFNMARKHPINAKEIKIKAKTEYVDEEMAVNMFYFPRDIAERTTKVNRLIEPILLRYYLNDWHSHNQ